MSLNRDHKKQAAEVLFSCKLNANEHSKLTFNGNPVQKYLSQKYLGLFSDNKLDL